jgi:hypothetical protein
LNIYFSKKHGRISLAGSLSDKILLVLGQLFIAIYGLFILLKKYPKVFARKLNYKDYDKNDGSKERSFLKIARSSLKKFSYVFFIYQMYMVVLTFAAGLFVAYEKGFCYLNSDGIIRGLEVDTFDYIDGGLEKQQEKINLTNTDDDIEMINNPLSRTSSFFLKIVKESKPARESGRQTMAEKYSNQIIHANRINPESIKKDNKFFGPEDIKRIIEVFK